MFTDGGDVGSGTRVRGGRMEKLFKAHVFQRCVAVVEIDRIPAQGHIELSMIKSWANGFGTNLVPCSPAWLLLETTPGYQ